MTGYQVDDFYKYNENKKTMTSHSWKTIVGLAIITLIGGLQAFHVSVPAANWIDGALGILLAIEHAVNGNTGA